MSYLPRMSSTYKEPQALVEDEPEDVSPSGSIQPASALANEKTYNPQTALKHYKYHPHPLPVLPGPSVTEEANENELFREASKLKRSQSRLDNLVQSESKISPNSPTVEPSKTSLADSDAVSDHPNETISKESEKIYKGVSPQKPSRVSINKKKASALSVDKKKENSSKQTINVCLVKTDVPESFVAAQTARPGTVNYDEQSSTGFLSRSEIKNLNGENTVFAASCSNPFRGITDMTRNSCEDDGKEFVHRGVQCTIFGCQDKTFIIPVAIKTLLKMLAFILHEINKDEVLGCSSAEGKRIMTQVQLILGDLCNQSAAEKNFGFDVTYSDSKRVEKLLEDLQRYLKNVYGTKGDMTDLAENLKNLFIQLKLKELELGILNDEIQESESLRMTDVEVKESELKNPEVTLQNKRLESEQLLAEVEFSKIEMRKIQKALAEADWDIKTGHEKMTNVKKSSASKSRTDILGRKPSVQRFSTEASRKGSRLKELEDSRTKKKT